LEHESPKLAKINPLVKLVFGLRIKQLRKPPTAECPRRMELKKVGKNNSLTLEIPITKKGAFGNPNN